MSRILRDLLMLCKWCRICVICCIFLEFTGFTSSLLVGVDSAIFTQFTGAVGELCKISLICSNFVEFSVDGSENSELDVDEF